MKTMKTMKTFFRIAMSFSVILAVMTGCEENLEFSRKVSFSAAGGYQNGPKTKTAYSADEYIEGSTSYERIDWVVNDLFQVVSDVARTQSAAAYADYKVTTVTDSSPKDRISHAGVAEAGTESLYWGDGTNTFYALYPSPATSGAPSGIAITTTTTGAGFTGVIPATQVVTKQASTDIYQPDMRCAYMWAAVSASSSSTDVNLAFKPAMTALEFTLYNPESTTLKVKKLTLSSESVALTGSFTGAINKSTLACTFSCPAKSTTNNQIEIEFSPVLEIPYDNWEVVTALALPQDLTGLTVQLTLADDQTRTLELKNATGSWYTFTGTKKYHITLGVPSDYVYVFEVTGGGTIDYMGGNVNYSVKSVKHFTNSSIEKEVAWSAVEFSTDGGTTWTTRPDWVTAFTDHEDHPGTTATTYQASFAVTPLPNSHTTTLKNNTAKGTETSPYDLSTLGGTASRTTANCYVVDAPGWYMLPLIYGNGIVDDATNENSYKTSYVSGARVLKPLKGWNDMSINDPNIAGTTGAELIWQDAQNLVTNVSYYNSNYLRFYVSKETICQGNAVIAAKNDDGTILWSWHIWVTDQDMNTTVHFQNSDFLPAILGWCDEGQIKWEAHNLMVRFTQAESGDKKTITINSNEHTEQLIGSGTYYQWGRKDPMLPARAVTAPDASAENHDNKTWYNAAGVASRDVTWVKFDKTVNTIGWAIQHPFTLILTAKGGGDDAHGDWQTRPADNLWNYKSDYHEANRTLLVPVAVQGKTIYDPCPAGYTVPPTGSYRSSMTPAESLFITSSMGTYDPNLNWYVYAGFNWPVLGNRLQLYGLSPAYNNGNNITGYGNYKDGYGKLYTSTGLFSGEGNPNQCWCVLWGSPLYDGVEIYGLHNRYKNGELGLYQGNGRANACNIRCIKEFDGSL